MVENVKKHNFKSALIDRNILSYSSLNIKSKSNSSNRWWWNFIEVILWIAPAYWLYRQSVGFFLLIDVFTSSWVILFVLFGWAHINAFYSIFSNSSSLAVQIIHIQIALACYFLDNDICYLFIYTNLTQLSNCIFFFSSREIHHSAKLKHTSNWNNWVKALMQPYSKDTASKLSYICGNLL